MPGVSGRSGGKREGSGRKPRMPADFVEQVQDMAECGMSLTSIAHYFGVSKASMDDWLAETDARIIYQKARAEGQRKLAKVIREEAHEKKNWKAIQYLDSKLEKQHEVEREEAIQQEGMKVTVGFESASRTPEQKAKDEEMMAKIQAQIEADTEAELKRLMVEAIEKVKELDQ